MGNSISSSKTARLISTLFVPPTFTILIFTYFAFALEHTAMNKFVLLGTALTFGFFTHIFFFFYLRRKGSLADNEASIKEERSIPYMAAILFYVVGFLVLLFFKINIISIAFWFCYISNTFFIFLINRKWKISAHLMGAGGPLAAVTFYIGPAGLLFIILPLIIGWARVRLNLHTISQVIAGALLGFFSTYIQMFLIVHCFTR